jgi:hypothetical protein
MSVYGLRNVAEIRLEEALDMCFLISGQLHDLGGLPCNCPICSSLEAAIPKVAALLRPGETRQISAKGTDLFLLVKRHSLDPKRQPASVPRLAPRKRAPQSRPGVQPAFLSSVRQSIWYR